MDKKLKSSTNNKLPPVNELSRFAHSVTLCEIKLIRNIL